MSNRNGGGSGAEAAGIVLVLAALAVIVWVSRSFGVDFATSAKMCLRWVIVLAAYGGLLYLAAQSSYDGSAFGRTWQLLLGGLWAGFWPALDFWAAQKVPAFMSEYAPTVWYGTWYAQWGILIAIVGGGWLFNRWRNDESPFGYGY